MPCVRYEELVDEPEKVVRELVKMFDIEMKEDNILRVLDAMKGHSQDGVFDVHEHKGYNFLYLIFLLLYFVQPFI